MRGYLRSFHCISRSNVTVWPVKCEIVRKQGEKWQTHEKYKGKPPGGSRLHTINIFSFKLRSILWQSRVATCIYMCVKGDMYRCICTRVQVYTHSVAAVRRLVREMKSREIFDSRTFTRTYSGPPAEKRSSPATIVPLRFECYYTFDMGPVKDSPYDLRSLSRHRKFWFMIIICMIISLIDSSRLHYVS